MASVKDKNLGLNLGWQFGETPWNTGMDTNMVVLGSMANLTVKSATTKAEPFGNDGDVYFIPVGATGSNWSGKANHIAIYSGESTYSTTNVASVIGWVFIPVRQGWTFTVQDQGNRLVTWDALLGLTDTVNVSTFLTAASSYTATGNVTFSGSVKFSGTHSADTTELATLGYVNSAISSQDFSNYAKLDASQTFTGDVVFSKEVQGKIATQPSSLATLKNVTDAISGITLENTGEGFGIAEINTNGNLTFKKLRSTNSTVSIVDTPEGLNLTVAMPVSVQEFTDLLDAPSSYVGAANQYVKVNTDASGLEFSEGFDEKFISLSDVPSSYIGSEGKYLVVEGGKVAFKALPSFSTAFKFTELTDTPNLIATSAVGRHNLLRGSRTSPAKLEFTGDLLLPQKSTELPQMPSVLEAGKYLRVKGDNSGYELVSGTGGGGSDSSTTIKGDWTPPVTSIPALAKMQRAGATFFPMADDLIDEVVFTDNSVSTSENGEGGMAIASMPFDISGSTEDRFAVYTKYEGSEAPDYIYYGTYAGLATLLNVGGMDMPFVFSPTVYYAPDLGLVEGAESDPVTLYADWNPHADSVAFVMDFDREVVEVWASRNNGTKVLEQTFVEIEQSIYDGFETVVTIDKQLVTRAALNTYFPVEEGESYRLVNSGKMSAAKTFDVSPSAVDVFTSTQSVDLTPPENAANNAFILDVSDPVHIPELGKELENGDIVFFDENKTPIRYIPKEFADDVDLSNYYTKSEADSALNTRVPKPAGFDEAEGDELKYISGKGTLKDLSTIQKLGNMPDVVFSTENVTIGGVPIGYDALVVLDKSTWGFGLVTDVANTLVENSMIVLAVEDTTYQIGSTIYIPAEGGTQAQNTSVANRKSGSENHSNYAYTIAYSYNAQKSAGIYALCEWDATTKAEISRGLLAYGDTFTWKHDDNGSGGGTLDSTMVRLVQTIPTLPTSAGKVGQLAADADYLYYCYAADNWATVPKSAFKTALGSMAFLSDPDSDGKAYARKDGAWVEVDKPQTIEVVIATKTLTAADNNKILLISEDGVTITLPSAIPNFSVDIVKMDEEFVTVVQTDSVDKFREDTTTITVTKDVTIFSTEVVGKEYVAVGAYEV